MPALRPNNGYRSSLMSISSWEPDPTGRHQYRWWDSEQWTDQVADDGVQSTDSISSAEAMLPMSTAPSTLPPSGDSEGLDFAEEPQADTNTIPADPMTMLASKGQRFGAFLLDMLLLVITLVVGYLIWSFIVWGQGQTPAKQLLKMRVIRVNDRQAAPWGIMAIRQFVLGAVFYGIDAVLIATGNTGFLGSLWLLANGIALLVSDKHQALWDKIVSTVVVSDPHNTYQTQ